MQDLSLLTYIRQLTGAVFLGRHTFIKKMRVTFQKKISDIQTKSQFIKSHEISTDTNNYKRFKMKRLDHISVN